ncbi:MAG: hypothetical protein ACRC16_17865, partial [Aeromonas salmonicida]
MSKIYVTSFYRGAGTSLFIRLPYSIKYDWIEKMKTNYSVLFLSMLMASAASAQTDAWFYKAFGQSTDSNFSSNVLPAKVGVNQVSRSEGEAPLRADVAYPLPASFILESRGGKLANSHDGMTVFYQAIPVDRAFVLQAE